MKYSISYKGKLLGEPMNLEQAEAALKKLSTCMNHLQIVPAPAAESAAVTAARRQLVGQGA